jgi:hypothetical protein
VAPDRKTDHRRIDIAIVVRHLVAGIGILLISIPLSVAVTLAMLPVWQWFEDRYEIESVGHSGPAEWCFLLMFLGCVSVSTALYVYTITRMRPESPRGGT